MLITKFYLRSTHPLERKMFIFIERTTNHPWSQLDSYLLYEIVVRRLNQEPESVYATIIEDRIEIDNRL